MVKNKKRFPFCLSIEAFGVGVTIRANRSEALDAIKERFPAYLPTGFHEIEPAEGRPVFCYQWNKNAQDRIYLESDPSIGPVEREGAIDLFCSRIRLKIAEFAKGYVFVHAGAVGWKGRAIIIPGMSFSGKTTLTAELVRQGAIYYSDEYAILDRRGRLLPFAKPLSIRQESANMAQIDHPVEFFGGKAGKRKLPVGLCVVTRYQKRSRWNPQTLSNGEGIMEIIKNCVPIRAEPEFTLKVLSKVLESASVIRTNRGDASRTAESILALVENEVR